MLTFFAHAFAGYAAKLQPSMCTRMSGLDAVAAKVQSARINVL